MGHFGYDDLSIEILTRQACHPEGSCGRKFRCQLKVSDNSEKMANFEFPVRILRFRDAHVAILISHQPFVLR